VVRHSLTRVFEKRSLTEQKIPRVAPGAGRWTRQKTGGKQGGVAFRVSPHGVKAPKPTDGPMRPSGTCQNPDPAAGVGLAVAGLRAVGPCPPDSRYSRNLIGP
jgi:hypothetical protein